MSTTNLLTKEYQSDDGADDQLPAGTNLLAQDGSADIHVAPEQRDWIHPNELDDPHAHMFLDPDGPEANLKEPEFVESGPAGVQKRPLVIEISDQVREGALDALVSRERDQFADDRHLILEYGPLASLEKRLRTICTDQADPEVADIIMTRVRRCMHDAVVTNTLLSKKETTEEGLNARIEATSDLLKAVEEQVDPFIDQLEALRYPTAGLLRIGIRNTIEVEQRRLETMTKSLVPASIGHRIFEGLSDIADKVMNPFAKEELVGDIRRHRNDQLAQTLNDLAEVTVELRERSGDEEWERVHGARSIELTKELTHNVDALCKGVEDQVDHTTVNYVLNQAQDNVSIAGEKAATEEHRSAMKKMLDMLRKALEAIAAVMERAFGKSDDNNKSGPTGPTPMRPAP